MMSVENAYLAFSRFTDPEDMVWLFADLPDDVIAICRIAEHLTIHHNLLAYYGVPPATWDQLRRVRPPRARDVLSALAELAPHDLVTARLPEQRVVGACVLESHLLASMLRYRGIPVRVRAGYFKDTRANAAHVEHFWEQLAHAPAELADQQRDNPARWIERSNAFTRKQNAVNHAIEHWICEYWDAQLLTWRLLDANRAFLKAHGDLTVGFHLPHRHFEYAHEAWRRMRSKPSYDPDQHAEEPQDGRSHIRSQLLSDFFSQLNHDVVGIDEPSNAVWSWLKEVTYEQCSAGELCALDLLADLLAQGPSTEALVAVYHEITEFRLTAAEGDPYSFVFSA